VAKRNNPITPILQNLVSDIERLRAEIDQPDLTKPARREIDRQLRQLAVDMHKISADFDTVRNPVSVFDPAKPSTVGRFVALALVAQPRMRIVELEPFYGSGVYAIYYRGAYPLYAPLSGTETPIYVGQAAPSSWEALTPREQGTALSGRMLEHRKSIALAKTTLDVKDFDCRFLVVQSGWETAAEDYLIRLFGPIWNNESKVLFGLGKHGDSAETRANKRSPWDTLHPGRLWAAKTLEDRRSPEQIEADVARHLAEHEVFPTLESVLDSFLAELRQL
jgi:hypothetical protein